jgi:hypothetical protein
MLNAYCTSGSSPQGMLNAYCTSGTSPSHSTRSRLQASLASLLLLLLCLSLLSSCGGGSMGNTTNSDTTSTLTNLMPMKDGQTEVFQNPVTGDTTSIRFEKVAGGYGCGWTGGQVWVWHYTKSNQRAYWSPGFDITLDWYVEDTGTMIHALGGWEHWGQQVPPNWGVTPGEWVSGDNISAKPGQLTYNIIPDTFSADFAASVPYYAHTLPGVQTTDCIPASADPQHANVLVPFKTSWTRATIALPFYSGDVVQAHYWEGGFGSTTPLNEEVWSFAPGIGLVQVQELQGGGQPCCPQDGFPLVMNRIR